MKFLADPLSLSEAGYLASEIRKNDIKCQILSDNTKGKKRDAIYFIEVDETDLDRAEEIRIQTIGKEADISEKRSKYHNNRWKKAALFGFMGMIVGLRTVANAHNPIRATIIAVAFGVLSFLCVALVQKQ